MADTFSNDLRVRLQESGSNAGTWGDLLNGTITNIASALGQGSEAIPNASTHTITLADGTADEARSLYLKCTGGGQACTVTLGPNTISKVWIIDNATSYTLTFRQGSGVNVAIAAGAVKVIATDGAGSGAAVVDTLDGLEGSLKTLAVNSGATTETTAAAIGYNGDVGTNLYINTDHDNNLVSLYASGSGSKAMRFLSGTLEVMRLATTGGVGIGTGANAISHQLVSYKSGANANYVQIASGSTGLGATNGLRLGVSSAGIGEIYSQSASPVMTFNANNVGIGASSLSQRLNVQTATVNTGMLVYNTSTTSGASVPFFLASESAGSTTNVSIENTDIGNLTFRTGATTAAGFGAERLRIAADGSISIPNQNAINELTFTGTEFTNVLSATTSGFHFGTTGAGYLSFFQNNTERLQITATGLVYSSVQYIGGFGAQTTGGTADFNHASNALSGNAFTLLRGDATNGPGGTAYYHVFNYEYVSKNGSGNMTQLAYGYNDTKAYMRYRLSNSWSAWVALH